MSKNLTTSHVITAGRIGAKSFERKEVTVEAEYFLELPRKCETYLNGQLCNVDLQTWSAWKSVLNRTFAHNETIEGSGVYRMTKGELAVLRVRGEELKGMVDMLMGVRNG